MAKVKAPAKKIAKKKAKVVVKKVKKTKAVVKKAKAPIKKAAKKIVKKAVAKKTKKNPAGTYTIHMREDLPWLHAESKKRGMRTSVFVKECINEYVKNHPVKADTKVA